jgi:hypothetical protein
MPCRNLSEVADPGYGRGVRHLRSILYALVLAPAAWILSGVGFTHDPTGRARDNGGAESFSGLLLLVLAGAVYAILVFAPISPAGPALAGLVFLGVSLWALASPSSYAGAWPAAQGGVDLSRPGYGLAALLAVSLVCTALSARRWERYEPPQLPLIGMLARPWGAAAAGGTSIAVEATEILDRWPSSVEPPTQVVAAELVQVSVSGAGVADEDDDAPSDEVTEDVPTVSPDDEVTKDIPTADLYDEITKDVLTVSPDDEITKDVLTAGHRDEVTKDVPAVSPDDEITKDVGGSGPKNEITTHLAGAGSADEITRDVAATVPTGEITTDLARTDPKDEITTHLAGAGSADEITRDVAATVSTDEITTDLADLVDEVTTDLADLVDEITREMRASASPAETTEAFAGESTEPVAERTGPMVDEPVTVAIEDDGEEKTQVISRPVGELTTRDVVRVPGERATRNIDDGGKTQVIGPDERTQVISRDRDRTQVINLAGERTQSIDGEKTQVITRTVEVPGEDTQVLTASAAPVEEDDRPPSIVGAERPNPGADPTSRIVPPEPERPPGEATTKDVGSGKRVMTVMNLERPAGEAADDTRRAIRPPIPAQRRRDDE